MDLPLFRLKACPRCQTGDMALTWESSKKSNYQVYNCIQCGYTEPVKIYKKQMVKSGIQRLKEFAGAKR